MRKFSTTLLAAAAVLMTVGCTTVVRPPVPRAVINPPGPGVVVVKPKPGPIIVKPGRHCWRHRGHRHCR